MSEVFVSFQSNDRDVAESIADAISGAGFSAWCYTQHVKGGADYTDVAARAIQDCDVMIVVITNHSLASDHVNSEIVIAKESGKQKMPILCGVSVDEYKATRPGWHYVFGATVCIEIDPGHVSKSIPDIISALADLRAVREGKPLPDGPPVPSARRPSAWKRLALPATLVLISIAGIALWMGGVFDRDNRSDVIAPRQLNDAPGAIADVGNPQAFNERVLDPLREPPTAPEEPPQPDPAIARYETARTSLFTALAPVRNEFSRVAARYAAWVPAIQSVLGAVAAADAKKIALAGRAEQLESAHRSMASAQSELTKVHSFEEVGAKWQTAQRAPGLDTVRQWAPDTLTELTKIASTASTLPTPDEGTDRLAESLERIHVLKLLAEEVREAKQRYEDAISPRRTLFERLTLDSYRRLKDEEATALRILNDLRGMKVAYVELLRRVEEVERERRHVAPRVAITVENQSDGIRLREEQIVRSLARAFKDSIPRMQSVRISPGTLTMGSEIADVHVRMVVQATAVKDDGFQDVIINDVTEVSGELTIVVVDVSTGQELAYLHPIPFRKVYTSRQAVKLSELVARSLEPHLDSLFLESMLDGL